MADVALKKNQLTVTVICHEVTDHFKELLLQIADNSWINEALFFDTSEEGSCKAVIHSTLSAAQTARSFKVSIHSEHISIWESDFAYIRNQMLHKITTECFMFLDSDELLSAAACKKIPQVLKTHFYDSNKSNISAISLPRHDYFLGKKLTYGETGKTALVRIGRSSQVTYQRNVHEIPIVTGEILALNTPILHFSHASVSEFIQTIVKYSYLEAQNRTKNKTTLLELIFYPSGKFIYTFFIKAGFLDGYRGLIYSFCMSLHSFFVRIYVWTK